MNGGILDEIYLSENIKFIKYYADREKEILDKIYYELEMCNNCYNSSSKVLMSKHINEMKINIERLFQKRQKYNEIFLQVIAKYNAMSDEIRQESIM